MKSGCYKSLLRVIEEIRIYLMRRFSSQRQERGNFGPNVIDKMNLFGKNMRYIPLQFVFYCFYLHINILLWTVVPSGGDVFETRYAFNGYKVDLSAHTCTCNLWMLSGIPCVHAQAAIEFIHVTPPNQYGGNV
ncbi:hypothetical protein LXL04_002506 [Taraxacum kok-saghyz]